MANANLITEDEVSIFIELFQEEYPHIYIQQIPAGEVQEFLSADYVRNTSISMQLNLAWDWCMAQQKCDVIA